MRLVALAVLAMPAVAVAQPGPDDPSPPGLTPPTLPPAPPPGGLELAAGRDAAADRAFGSSTALVVPRGTADISVRFGPGFLVGSAAIGLGSGLELSADLGRSDSVGAAGAALKVAVVRGRMVGLALEGGVHNVGDSDSGDGDITVWSAGAAASVCSDDPCSALLSATAGMAGRSGYLEPYGTASLVLGTGGFRPILEGALASGGGIGFVGARLGGHNVAIDVGVALAADGEASTLLPGFGLSIRP